ncbi:T cell receptor V alpha chain [Listeria monocytogenes FSL F2-208]|nr:T cell receptor V alpha chain [Listeria monocytogenes FSL F2-208]
MVISPYFFHFKQTNESRKRFPDPFSVVYYCGIVRTVPTGTLLLPSPLACLIFSTPAAAPACPYAERAML